MPSWDPNQYLKFAAERTQPCYDLIHRIALSSPARIADLGCGPGNSSLALRNRWPDAEITGVDSSAEMIEKARESYPQGRWEVGDAATWQAPGPLDLIFSNAMLQWVPDHEAVCRRLIDQLAPGGALAVQVPAHYDSPLHAEIFAVSREPQWNERMHDARGALTNHPPAFYYDALIGHVSRLDIWETTYQHVVDGPESVIEWFRATGLRPFLDALTPGSERQQFEQLLLDRYTVTYPRRPNGRVLFPFRRLFFVAYR